MRSKVTAERAHILIYEPRVEGHHVGYLKFITEDMLGAGHQVTLAIDTRIQAIERIRAQMADSLNQCQIISVYDSSDRRIGRTKIGSVAACLKQSGADFVFLNTLDEIGSALLRRAAFGLLPPSILRGRLGGIYHRPRFLAPATGSPNHFLKAAGFRKLIRGGWFSHILLFDPYLLARFSRENPKAPLFQISDCYPDNFHVNKSEARRKFQLPAGSRVFLFYGGAYRRKGLPLAVQAMTELPRDVPAFLLCAGQQKRDREVESALAALERAGRAMVINRYVSAEDERALFGASDFVLLPYRRHFGISGVLVRAVGAGVPVVVSDEELLGRLVSEHELGLLFPSGDTRALSNTIKVAAESSETQVAHWHAALQAFAPQCSRSAFREALVGALNHAIAAKTLLSPSAS